MATKVYLFSEANDASKLFDNFFNLKLKDYVDDLMSAISKHITLDVIKFDDYLMQKFNYPDGESMKDCIEKNYGKDAAKFIDCLI